MKKIGLLLALFSFFWANLDAQCPNFSRPGVHVVQSGQNLYRIAKMYNVSMYDLAQWNGISTSTTLYACQELDVNGNNARPAQYSEEVFTERSPTNYNTASGQNYRIQGGNKHTVQQGETVERLARLYGYTVERFRRINLLQPGEQLTPGSVILSSDCACDRVSTYDEVGSATYYTNNDNTNSRVSSDYYQPDIYTERGKELGDPEPSRVYNSTYPDIYEGVDNKRTTATQPTGRITSASNPGSGSFNTPSNYSTDDGRINTRPSTSLPTKAAATYMTNEELSMLEEINLVRSNPPAYVKYVEEYKEDIRSGRSFGSSIEVCDELIAELRNTPPLSILQPLSCIYEAAKKHGMDQKQRGSTGHNGTDGSWPWDRVKRECTELTDGNENLVGGPSSVREAVLLLLVDDGIPSRGHRKTMLNKDWKYGACYKIGQVGFMPNCWVQKFGY